MSATSGGREAATSVDEWLEKNKKIKGQIEGLLQEGEAILVLIEGAFKQLIIGTNRRVIVFKKGLMAGTTFGSKITSWEYGTITGIQLETRVNSGSIVIRAAGEESILDTSYWKNGKGSAKEAPNAVVFSGKPNQDVHQLVADLDRMVGEAHAGGGSPQDGPMEQLKKLAELRDAGIVTPEEFEAKKQELLKRI